MKTFKTTIKSTAVIALTVTLAFSVVGCERKSYADEIKEKAELVKVCTESGGSWHINYAVGLGERCNFDTRK